MKMLKSFFKWIQELIKEADQNGKIYREVIGLRQANAALTEHVQVLTQLLSIQKIRQKSDDQLKRVIDFFQSGMAMTVAEGAPGPSCPECGEPMRVTYDKGKFVASCLPCIGTRINNAVHDAMVNRPGNWQTDDILPLVHPYLQGDEKSPDIEPSRVVRPMLQPYLNSTGLMCMECFKYPATHEIADSNNYKVCDSCYQDIKNGH